MAAAPVSLAKVFASARATREYILIIRNTLKFIVARADHRCRSVRLGCVAAQKRSEYPSAIDHPFATMPRVPVDNNYARRTARAIGAKR